VIIAATFRTVKKNPAEIESRLREYMAEKISKQPIEKKTLGCVFKNPAVDTGLTSGQMIDRAGLKGLAFGGARISEKHANFIENAGGASADDVNRLIAHIKKVVLEKYGVLLDQEIEIL
jgi:UDP-N-acetylmuramate dehydrogenase